VPGIDDGQAGDLQAGQWPTLRLADAGAGFVRALNATVNPSVFGHELSHQNGARGGGRDGFHLRSRIGPPQSGQTSSTWPVERKWRSR